MTPLYPTKDSTASVSMPIGRFLVRRGWAVTIILRELAAPPTGPAGIGAFDVAAIV
jgi:hypothetical protein